MAAYKAVNGVLVEESTGTAIALIEGDKLYSISGRTEIGTFVNNIVTWNSAGTAMGYSTTSSVTGQTGVTTSSLTHRAARLLAEAYGYDGMAYRLGGDGSDGTIDCSGLVMRAFAAIGVTLPHWAQGIYDDPQGTMVARSELKPGDILFFGPGPHDITHTAIYIGDDMMIEAGDGSGGTSVTKVAHRSNYVGAKRLSMVDVRYQDFSPSPVQGQYAMQYAYNQSAKSAAASYANSKEAVDDIFYQELGRPATDAEASKILDGNWSSDHVLRYIMDLPEWGPKAPGYEKRRADYQAVWNEIIGLSTAPESLVSEWIEQDLSVYQAAEAIRALPEYKDGNEYLQNKYQLIHEWETRTGRPMSEAAQSALAQALVEQWPMARWDAFIEVQPEYMNGTEYAGRKVVVTQVLRRLWGEGVVDAKLAADPNYVENVVWDTLGEDADAAVIAEWARTQPEWLVGPEASTERATLEGFYASVMRTAMPADLSAQAVREGWNTDQLLERLKQTPEYQALYSSKPAWLSETAYIDAMMTYNSVGRMYYGESFQFSGEQVRYFLEKGVTAGELQARYAAIEAGNAQMGGSIGTWSYYLEAVGITLTADMAYTIASGGEGSGALRAAIVRGTNRRSFDEEFKRYTGRMPSQADYEYLETNFVSASEYAARMGAKEYAAEVFPAYNELFMRVYGYEADLSKLEDVAMGAEGSGVYKGLIAAAEEMDRYTAPWREYARTDPTPQQYAEWAGFSGPGELEKLLNAQELVQDYGHDFISVYNAYWTALGAAPMTEDDVFTLVGKYQGWGAIDARMRMAQEHRDRQDTARKQWLSSLTAQAYTTITQFGGPKIPFLSRPQG